MVTTNFNGKEQGVVSIGVSKTVAIKGKDDGDFVIYWEQTSGVVCVEGIVNGQNQVGEEEIEVVRVSGSRTNRNRLQYGERMPGTEFVKHKHGYNHMEMEKGQAKPNSDYGCEQGEGSKVEERDEADRRQEVCDTPYYSVMTTTSTNGERPVRETGPIGNGYTDIGRGKQYEKRRLVRGLYEHGHGLRTGECNGGAKTDERPDGGSVDMKDGIENGDRNGEKMTETR